MESQNAVTATVVVTNIVGFPVGTDIGEKPAMKVVDEAAEVQERQEEAKREQWCQWCSAGGCRAGDDHTVALDGLERW